MTDQITLEEYKTTYRKDRLAEEKRLFYKDLLAFVIVNTGLAAINLYFYPSFWYFLVPLVGWGIAAVVHYVRSVRHAERNLERKEEAAELEAKFFKSQ